MTDNASTPDHTQYGLPSTMLETDNADRVSVWLTTLRKASIEACKAAQQILEGGARSMTPALHPSAIVEEITKHRAVVRFNALLALDVAGHRSYRWPSGCQPEPQQVLTQLMELVHRIDRLARVAGALLDSSPGFQAEFRHEEWWVSVPTRNDQ